VNGLEQDQRDLPYAWHLKALAVTAAALGLVYLMATRYFL
jgi:hypothetical protein